MQEAVATYPVQAVGTVVKGLGLQSVKQEITPLSVNRLASCLAS